MGQLFNPSLQIGNVVVGGTAGSVLFVSPTLTLGQDNANFRWDDANNQLLLGNGNSTNPAYSFAAEPGLGIFRPVAGSVRIQATVGAAADFNASRALIFGGQLNLFGDVILQRDAANILAQRNGTNPQTHRIYNTFTDTSNYERLAISAPAGTSSIIQEQAGTGAVRSIRLGTAGGSNIFLRTNGADKWAIIGGGIFEGNLDPQADNSYDMGRTGGVRPRSIFIATSLQIEANQGLRLTNQVDGAGANIGTLANAPSAGDPAFWIPITLNGSTRFIPAWA